MESLSQGRSRKKNYRFSSVCHFLEFSFLLSFLPLREQIDGAPSHFSNISPSLPPRTDRRTYTYDGIWRLSLNSSSLYFSRWWYYFLFLSLNINHNHHIHTIQLAFSLLSLYPCSSSMSTMPCVCLVQCTLSCFLSLLSPAMAYRIVMFVCPRHISK